MNWSRGFFRLWLVAAVLWTAFVLTISWLNTPELVEGKSRLSLYCRYEAVVDVDLDDDSVVKWLLETARQEQTRAACRGHAGTPQNNTDAAASPLLTDDEIASALLSFHADQARRPSLVFEHWLSAIALAVIPAAVIFAVGWAVLWALSGFRVGRKA